jgi:hypothetical protein
MESLVQESEQHHPYRWDKFVVWWLTMACWIVLEEFSSNRSRFNLHAIDVELVTAR